MCNKQQAKILKPHFSVIIPVYNRPDEVDELLRSLADQIYKDFEVIVVEDGSIVKCDQVVEKYKKHLNISYFCKDNTGPGLTRNYGADKASGNYYIFFDSDCIIPPQYMQVVKRRLSKDRLDAYGGPDAAHPSFTPIQKAINYAMTSFFTTGGIRGGQRKMDHFHPRSFNMGISQGVYEATDGFAPLRFGEDIDLSMRIVRCGFTTGLIPNAFVYHKRRTNFRQFFKQVFNSGIARINLHMRHPGSMKLVHLLPACFVLGIMGCVALGFLKPLFLAPIVFFILAIFTDSLIRNHNTMVALLSIPAAFVQLFAYGTGFLVAFWNRIIRGKAEFHAFGRTFYD